MPPGSTRPARAPEPAPPPAAVQRWRIVLEREAGDVAQRDHELAWEAALEASGLPCLRASGGRGMPRIVFAVPLPLRVAGEGELAEILLVERRRSAEVRAALEPVLPSATRLRDLHDVWLGAPGLPSLVTAAAYRIDLEPGTPSGPVGSAVDGLLAAAELPRVRGGDRRYDLRPLIESLSLEGAAGDGAPGDAGARLRCRLRHDPVLGTGRPDELVAALEERLGAPLPVRATVRERLILADGPGG